MLHGHRHHSLVTAGLFGLQQHGHGVATHPLVRDLCRGQLGPEVAGDFVVVEGGDRYVVWDFQAAFLDRLVGAEGEPVVHADQPGDLGVTVQDLLGGLEAVVRLPDVVLDLRGHGDLCAIEDGFDSGEPVADCRGDPGSNSTSGG